MEQVSLDNTGFPRRIRFSWVEQVSQGYISVPWVEQVSRDGAGQLVCIRFPLVEQVSPQVSLSRTGFPGYRRFIRMDLVSLDGSGFPVLSRFHWVEPVFLEGSGFGLCIVGFQDGKGFPVYI